jgi:hypothetical protein
MNAKIGIAAGAVLGLVMVVASFFVGAYVQKGNDNAAALNTAIAPAGSQQSNVGGAQNGGDRGNRPGGAGGGFGGMGGRGGVASTITAVSGNDITVKAADGTISTVTIAAGARITKSQTLTAADLAVGQTVRIDQFNDPNGNGTTQIITIQ